MLITNDTELRTFLKNVQSTVTGEESLFDKLSPQLLNAELWLVELVTDGITLTEDMQPYAKAAIAHKAFYDAIPQLDLILTPNGFGIVSNQNVAPASTERVKNLRTAELSARDEAIDRLFRLLFASEDYRRTERFRYYSSSVFQTPALAAWLGETPQNGRLEFYLTTSSDLRVIESHLIDNHVSRPIFDGCCSVLATGSSDDGQGEHYIHIARLIRLILISSYKSKDSHTHRYCDDLTEEIVDYIRNTPTLFEVWKDTPAGKAYESANFVNAKDSSGYWL